MVIDNELRVKQYRYWQPQYRPQKMTLQEAVERTREALFESVRLRLRSDVPLAFCLSGGVDSGALVSIAGKVFGHEVAAFSIVDSDERYNEYENIMATVRDIGCQHTIVELRPQRMLERLRSLVAYHDAPVATISYFVHSYLSEAIAAQGYRVAFSGTAADELFTGYFDHWMWHLVESSETADFADKLRDWQEHIKPIVRNRRLRDPERFIGNPGLRDHIYHNSEEFHGYSRVDFEGQYEEVQMSDSLLRNRMLNELFYESTPLILHEDDLNSMRYSIENRSPYLDSRLFDVAYSIPTEHLMSDGYSKFPLREAIKGVLNDQVRLDRHKKGFNASVHSIIDVNNIDDRDYILSPSPIYEFVDRAAVERLLERQTLPNHFSKFLFSFISAKIFLEQKVDVESVDMLKLGV